MKRFYTSIMFNNTSKSHRFVDQMRTHNFTENR